MLSLTITCTVTMVVGYSTGAPTSTCATITPDHIGNTATGPVPYSVNISSLDGGYMPGQNYTSEKMTRVCFVTNCGRNLRLHYHNL